MSARVRALRVLPAAIAASAAVAYPRGAAAQEPLTLGALQQAAVVADARTEQLPLLASQSDLRLEAIATERLPSLSLQGQGQYQSTVFELPFTLPGGAAPPAIPHDSYDAHLMVRQSLYDPARSARAGVERARLAQGEAGVDVALQQIRQAVVDAYFSVLRLEAQREEMETGLVDMRARLEMVQGRVEERAALPGEAAMIEAELLRRQQLRDQLLAEAGAARRILADLAAREVPAGVPLPLPELEGAFTRARGTMNDLRERPEYSRFDAQRALLERQEEVAAATERPRVSAFGRAGYGRPGLNPISTDFDRYWLTGVQVEWSPWRWGAAGRDREVLALERRLVDTEESAFTANLRRAAIQELAAVDRLIGAVALDERIVALRLTALEEARLRFDEGVITSAEYVDRETDLLEARLARIGRGIELAQARARFLTLLGIEIP